MRHREFVLKYAGASNGVHGGWGMRRGWTVRDSLELYNVSNWGDGFFSINAEGNVAVQPRGDLDA